MPGTGFASIAWRRRRPFRRHKHHAAVGLGLGDLHQKVKATQGTAGHQKPKRIEARRQHDDGGGAGDRDIGRRTPLGNGGAIFADGPPMDGFQFLAGVIVPANSVLVFCPRRWRSVK
jgi:hypothetical protein